MTNPVPAKLIIGDEWKKKDDAPAPASAGSGAPGGPGLVVDSDWKSQAQAEKEKLAAAERAKAEARGAKPGAADAAEGQPGRGEKIDFQALMGTLATQALMYMGAFPDESGRAMVSLEHARFHIDLLAVLEEKTRGNLTAAEADELKGVAHELRMRYVDISQAVMKAAKERIAKGGAGAAAPIGPVMGG